MEKTNFGGSKVVKKKTTRIGLDFNRGARLKKKKKKGKSLEIPLQEGGGYGDRTGK